MVKRPEWNEYFGEITKQVALRSTCVRKKVGAIIVKDKNIISTGYNGSIRGLEHCETIGCLMMEGHCTRTIHAEANAIIQAAKHGLMIDRAEIYISASPCFNCFKLIANSGITKIYFMEFYRDERIIEIAKKLDIELIDMSK